MYPEDLASLLREITVSAIARNADGADEVHDLIRSIEDAVATRRIVDCVQFEEIWEEPVDPSVDKTGVAFYFVGIKLSPEVCEAAFELDDPLNELTWTLLLPDVDTLKEDERPESAVDLLALAEIDLDTRTDRAYETLKSIIVPEDIEADD
jgi:hypothetical protein